MAGHFAMLHTAQSGCASLYVHMYTRATHSAAVDDYQFHQKCPYGVVGFILLTTLDGISAQNLAHLDSNAAGIGATADGERSPAASESVPRNRKLQPHFTISENFTWVQRLCVSEWWVWMSERVGE